MPLWFLSACMQSQLSMCTYINLSTLHLAISKRQKWRDQTPPTPHPSVKKRTKICFSKCSIRTVRNAFLAYQAPAHMSLFFTLWHPGTAAPFQFQQSRSNHLVRKELQQHLYQHQQQLQGYTDYIQRNAHHLLALVVDKPVEQPQTAEMTITAKEFERLGLLLRPAETQGSDPGSPMEISPTPFAGLP